jgi:TP901 family phage tail tape measure protein
MAARFLVEIGATLSGSFNAAFGRAGSSARELGSTISRLNATMGNVSEFRRVSQSAGVLRTAYENARAEARRLGDEIARTDRPTRAQTAAFRMASDAAQAAERSWREENATLRQLGESLRRAGVNTQQLASEQRRLGQESTRANQQMRRAQIGDAMANERNRRSDHRGTLMGAAAAGASLAFPVAAAFKASSDFESKMVMIGNTANMTSDQVKALGDSVLKLSEQTGQSATTMQGAMGFLIAAGMDAKTAENSLVAIGRTATASGSEIEDVAKAAFVLNDAMKINPAQLQNALDVLAQASKEGKVEFKDMAKQLPVLGSGFSALKIQGNEAAASMGAALEIAIKGASDADEAANNMKNYIAKIMSPETLKKAKKNFNLDLYSIITDAQKTGKNPFDESMKAIIKATKGDQKAIGDLFQDMQVQNFVRPMIQNWDEYMRIKEKALNANGVTDADFAAVAATSAQKTKELGNAWERMKIQAGASLAPSLTKLVVVLTPLVKKLGDFIKENPKLTATMVGVTAATIGLVGAFAIVGMAFSQVRTGILLLKMAWPHLIHAFMFMRAVVIPQLVTAFTWLTGVLMANPFIAIAAAVGLAAFLIIKYWEPIKAFFLQLWQFVDGVFEQYPILNYIFPLIGAARMIINNWEPLKQFFIQLWADITATFNASIDWIIQKINKVGEVWGKMKSWVGMGDGESPKLDMGPPPNVAAAAVPGGGNRNATTNNQIQINMNGTGNSQSDARAMREQLDAWSRQQQAKQRAGMNDNMALGY